MEPVSLLYVQSAMSVSNSSFASQNIALAFPTLIGRFQIAHSAAVNAGLLRLALEHEAAEVSRDYANVGGWHSAGDLLDWPGPEIAELRKWIIEGLNRMVQATGQLPEVRGRPAPRGNFTISAWANISRRGNYHRMHNHPFCAWSGVYYVTGVEGSAEAGSDKLEPNALAGVLELYDPRSFTEMVEVPGTPYGQRVHIRPEPGLLILFPSWLYHFVHPSHSDAERVSIAFNAAWRSA